MARLAALVAAACLALVLSAPAGAAVPAAGAAKKCKKGQALHKSKCVKRCPRGYAKRRARGRVVCRKAAAPPGPQPGPQPQPAPQTQPIEGEEAKGILKSLLVGRVFENAGTTSSSGGSVSGREQYAFCDNRYGWYSFTSSSIPGFGGSSDERGEGGTWSVAEAVADPSRTKAVGRLQLNPEGGQPRTIQVGIDDTGTDRVDGYDMESKPFDCAAAGA